MCVCNATYCDDFPPLRPAKQGFATVYESNKVGDRFKETELKFGSTTSGAVSDGQRVTVTIDATKKYQSIYGFGAAFTDSTGQMLASVDESLANQLIDSYFSENGIEYSVARVPMAGTDFSDRPYSYDDVDEDLELKHFALQREDIDWKIPYIKRALKVSPHKVKLFGSPWSPPAWMKTNHKFEGNGYLRGAVGGPYYQAFANYFVKFLEAYKSHGIEFWGLTVENEPNEGQNNKNYNCLNLTGPTERDFVKLNLGPTLAKAGYGADKVALMVYDDNLGELKHFVTPILEDKEAMKYVSGIAFHWYGNGLMDVWPDSLLDEFHEKYPDTFIINTEACHLSDSEPSGVRLGNWEYAEHYAYDIIRDLNKHMRGWVEWNMALDMKAGPRWNEKQGYGGCVNIDPAVGEAYKQPSFYAIGHFSKFIAPDSVRVHNTADQTFKNFSVLTVQRPDNQLVLVALNARSDDIELNIVDSTRSLSHKIPAHSVQSYIW
ncbi:unnamed protein product [Medioppia subpectinata]|uniref:Glucosylceramidase n=1 Tax=Medioppia subpectinata TaxID=1979941 RepID=A0A7R9KQ36_9ACAR|nr:unnamed protein product [Medioppia subpectinata]CAG2106584.1 unnamed protein product [Medioppia subpectinata]